MEFGEKAIVAGLTGMSGAGKSTACAEFRERGFAIADCDSIARFVVGAGKPALSEIAARFGEGYILPDGSLDRRKLGGLVFSSEADRLALNSIIYPYISYEMIRAVISYINEGKRYILLDAPTLFESGTDMLCEKIVSVTADTELCVSRIMRRDGLSEQQARSRLSSQHGEDFYRSRSDFCVRNDGTEEELRESIRRIAEEMKASG